MDATIYSLCGLRIASDFPLFGLQVCQTGVERHCDVVIRCAPIPDEVASTIATFRDGHFSGTYDGREVLLSRPVGCFLLRAGQEILMDLESHTDHDEARAYLLGPVLGALFHQRGITPLHASAIDVADGCVAFVGASGAGKSTLAAALARRGHQIIADDTCFLQLDANREVRAWPGICRIRLCEDAKVALGFDGSNVEREMQGNSKHFVTVSTPRNATQSRPLRRVYQLDRIPTGCTKVTRLRGAEAVEVLMRNIYPRGLADRLGYHSNVFAICAAAARDIAVFRLSRPRDFAALDQGIELLENHLRDITCPSA